VSFGRDPRERAWADLKRTLDAHAEAIRGLQQHARQQPQAPPAHYVQLGGARPHEEDDKFREHEARYANTIHLVLCDARARPRMAIGSAYPSTHSSS
jgi:hypothetical protein